MEEIPSYLTPSSYPPPRKPRGPYIHPCKIVSWAFIYFFVFALLFTAIFFAGRNFQRHDRLGPQHGFGNRTDFINLFLLISIPFMYFSAQFGHYHFPSISYVIPLFLGFHYGLKKYDGLTTKSIFVLWIPVHFCVLVVWYFHTVLVREEPDRQKREFMKYRFVAFLMFYMCLLLKLDGMLFIVLLYPLLYFSAFLLHFSDSYLLFELRCTL